MSINQNNHISQYISENSNITIDNDTGTGNGNGTGTGTGNENGTGTGNENGTDNLINRLEQQKTIFNQIKDTIKLSKKDKAVLSLKYDDLSFKINMVQLSIILFSTLITFVETIKLQYGLNENVGTLIPIIFSTYIALILAIFRFLKWDDKKENISNNLERFSFVINKCRKTKHYINNFTVNNSNIKQWDDLISNYENETYDYLITTRENFDNIMTYRELVYYREKLRTLYIEEKFIKDDIDNIELIQNTHRNFNEDSYCCGIKSNKINYDLYLDDLENKKNKPNTLIL